MTPIPSKESPALESLRDALHSLLVIALLLAIVGAAFAGAHKLLSSQGLTDSLWQTAGIWVGVGLACAFFWPLRYWRGMQGHWGPGTFIQAGLLSLTGPFALLLGFPL